MPGVSDFKKSFFDRAAVTSKVDAATRRVLSKMGAFVRRRAKSSIRKRKKVSAPGQPPSSHVGTLRNLLFFGYDSGTKTVVVGPAAFERTRLLGGKTTPETLEEGGVVPKVEYQLSSGLWVSRNSPLLKDRDQRGASGKLLTRDQRKIVEADVSGRPKRTLTPKIAARPYMGPAYRAELPKFAQMFKNSVTR